MSVLLAGHPATFKDAKDAAQKIWSDNKNTFYSQCSFDDKMLINTENCAYLSKQNPKKSKVGWMHLVPVVWFEKQLPCWREYLCEDKRGKKFKGLACCELLDKDFSKMMTDLHNIVPEIQNLKREIRDYRISGLKHDNQFGDFYLQNNPEQFKCHGCKMFLSKDYQLIEPADELKGMVARAHLYMASAYPLKLSQYQKKMFSQWNSKYPPTDWERKWNDRIKEIQGTDNYFISKYSHAN